MSDTSPETRERADERTRLYQLIEASARFFEAKLRSSEGEEARRYIEKRGLKRETIAEFGVGYAPAGRAVLKAHLAAEGFTVEEMAASGMLISGRRHPRPL